MAATTVTTLSYSKALVCTSRRTLLYYMLDTELFLRPQRVLHR